MTKEEFVLSFTDDTKILLMDAILGEVYDKIQENAVDSTRIIRKHLDEFVENTAADTRIGDLLLEDEIRKAKLELEKLRMY